MVEGSGSLGIHVDKAELLYASHHRMDELVVGVRQEVARKRRYRMPNPPASKVEDGDGCGDRESE